MTTKKNTKQTNQKQQLALYTNATLRDEGKPVAEMYKINEYIGFDFQIMN
jgi:hypothetical protein